MVFSDGIALFVVSGVALLGETVVVLLSLLRPCLLSP